jgi:hypothetical protein
MGASIDSEQGLWRYTQNKTNGTLEETGARKVRPPRLIIEDQPTTDRDQIVGRRRSASGK